MKYLTDYQESANYIQRVLGGKNPKIAMILGSGLSFMADLLEDKTELPYRFVPGFAAPTVKTHAGKFSAGWLGDKEVLLMNGRYHYYEGHTMEEVVYPIRVMKLLGIETLIVTNAAGGINKNFQGGDIMLITDHIKMWGDSPLRGENLDAFGERFPDMSHAYDPGLLNLAKDCARDLFIPVQTGVYGYAGGPQYETPAEVRAFGILGADAVGMSTVPEVIAANHCGMKVLGISCITNMAAGLQDHPLNDDEVNAVAKANKEKISKLLLAVTEQIETGEEA